ncbi:hypothetical protein C1I98_07865 [Spongiactinospora gelatinilytica]|uniref:Uncharacterized protein n=1 Tax=Spongiactinospora gelatinilytica TaxID=2666298 RepID=A0A2W2IQB9_9ACTN|nr:hypothetical protein C1I98_07865 [Spongiactinospora gelatinilytica]
MFGGTDLLNADQAGSPIAIWVKTPIGTCMESLIDRSTVPLVTRPIGMPITRRSRHLINEQASPGVSIWLRVPITGTVGSLRVERPEELIML